MHTEGGDRHQSGERQEALGQRRWELSDVHARYPERVYLGRSDSLASVTSYGNCDTAVIRRPPSTSRDAWIVFEFWSGARDLNPGPHGPEPCVGRVLPCPAGSSSVLLHSISRVVVSPHVLLCPPSSA